MLERDEYKRSGGHVDQTHDEEIRCAVDGPKDGFL
jgi:hypothetical protein